MDLKNALRHHQAAFGLELSEGSIERLFEYWSILQDRNALLHLVAPCSEEEFAVRHILESLTLINELPPGAKFIDVGAGGGLPSIPCLLVRDDLSAVLIESKEKKAAFLSSAAERLGIAERVTIEAKQFTEAECQPGSAVTCRALDKFIPNLKRLVKWAGKSDLLLFGGPALGAALEELGIKFSGRLMPESEQRYLFISRGTDERHRRGTASTAKVRLSTQQKARRERR